MSAHFPKKIYVAGKAHSVAPPRCDAANGGSETAFPLFGEDDALAEVFGDFGNDASHFLK